MDKRLLLIDATGLLFRAYFSIRSLTAPDGTAVNAVFGLLRMLLKVFRDLPASASGLAFDAGEKTFRNDMFANYKAQRPPPPEDLGPQFDLALKTMQATGAPVYSEAGFEADDIIATLAVQATALGYSVSVLTGDRDILQLVSPDIEVLLVRSMGDHQAYQPARFAGEYGFAVERFVDYKALMGDPSDNIPGIPGVGKVTAAKLVQSYGKLEQLYANIDAVKPDKLRQKLKQHREEAFLYRDLVTLRTDVPVAYDFAGRTLPNFGSKELVDMLTGFGFGQLTEDAKKAGDLQARQ